MILFFEILKAILFGVVEGITEWLPISSTGHMIILEDFVKEKVEEKFENSVLSNDGSSGYVLKYIENQPVYGGYDFNYIVFCTNL